MWPSTSSKRTRPKPTFTRPALSPRSTLTEVLKANPFRGKDGQILPDTTTTRPTTPDPDDETIILNKNLLVLAEVFPDVQIDVLRELLVKFDGDSSLQVCTEELYRHKAEWADGRMQNPPRDEGDQIPLEQRFRSTGYRQAVRQLLSKEFTALNKSAIEAVLAEVNDSYTKARPILKDITSKSWRATFMTFFRRKRDPEIIPLVILCKNGKDLLPSGNAELDAECYDLYLGQTRQIQENVDQDKSLILARKLNETEATAAGALFECQVCYNDVTFEDMAACTSEAHIICLDCVRRSLNEAIFGQSWTRSVDQQKGTLRCLAPVNDPCDGYISLQQVKHAVLSTKSGVELYAKFEDRLCEKSLFESQMTLRHCPFCPYAEVEYVYTADMARHLLWDFRPLPPYLLLAALILILALFPFLILMHLLDRAFLPRHFYTSLAHLARRQQTKQFKCRSPNCARRSCTHCNKIWHDPHICHEPLLLSLRQSVEAARTAAVKRVCPRCGTAFVKSSGCNKLTCVCGYAMCYLCRKNIGKTGENEGAEGYRHFCEHFRPVPGQKCTVCEKCDLYKAEDEDSVVKRAGEEAEREWRVKEGMVGVKGLEGAIAHDGLGLGTVDNLVQRLLRGDWTVQGAVDIIVQRVVKVYV